MWREEDSLHDLEHGPLQLTCAASFIHRHGYEDKSRTCAAQATQNTQLVTPRNSASAFRFSRQSFYGVFLIISYTTLPLNMRYTIVLAAAFAGLGMASPAVSSNTSPELEKRYTDWPGCMQLCNTPTCGIPNCYAWCKRVCCGQFPSYPGC